MEPSQSRSDAVTSDPGHVPLLDKLQAATLLATTPRHVERLVQDGRLSYCRVGRFIRFKLPDLMLYLEQTHVPSQLHENQHHGNEESR